MKYSRSELLAFIPDIYDAAGDPTKWNNVLLRLTELAGAHAGHIYFQDIKTSQVGWVAYAGLTIDDGRRYRDHYAAINPFWTNRPELYSKAGDVFTRKMISDNATCGRTEFYNDFAKPLRLFDFVGGTLFKQGTRSGRLALFRPPEAEPCGKEEMELVRLLMPHLVRSIELHTKIAHLENNSEILLNTLDHPTGRNSA